MILLRSGKNVFKRFAKYELKLFSFEIRSLIGADAVGMSTVPEVIVAVHAGLKVLGFSAITDECFPDALQPVNIGKIIATAERVEPQLAAIVEACIARITV